MRSPVSTGYSAACRSRDSCPTCLSSRSGLQPSFPVRPICCLHLSAWSASLALPTTWPTMPSADFCPAVRPPYGALSRRSDTEQISSGKFSRLPCIVAGSTLRILDGYGLRGKARSSDTRAFYPIFVHRLARLLYASFRPRLAATALALSLTLHLHQVG